MAEEQQQRERLLFVVDYERHGNLVFEVNLKGLFVPESPETETETETEMEMAMLPFPVASLEPEIMAFAFSGATIVGLHLKRTFTYDTEARSVDSGPATAARKSGAFLLPVGADDVYALSLFPHLGRSAPGTRPHLEALTLTAGAGEDHPTTLSWRAVPDPPPELQDGSKPGGPCCKVATCFTMDGRLWLSASGQGTFSLDTAAGTWRKEGAWEMPVEGLPAVYLPELGRLLGFCPDRLCLCACDMEARPPVVREVWEETWPWECVKMGYGIYPDASLVYLGGGRLCITRLVGKDDPDDNALCVQAVHLQLRRRRVVEMVKRRVRCYTMSKTPRRAWAFHPTTT